MKTSYCRNLKTKTLLQVIEIIPWKVRTNDFYSRSICDASKKITSEHSKRVFFFFSLHCNEWIKIVEAIFMVRCFYFMHTNLISHFNANKRLWMYIFRPIRDTNKSPSRSNSQYVWDKYYYAYIFFPWTKQIHLVGATVECSVTNCIQASQEGFLGFRRHTYKPLSLLVTKQTLFIRKCCLAKLEAQMPRATLLEHCTSSVSNR